MRLPAIGSSGCRSPAVCFSQLGYKSGLSGYDNIADIGWQGHYAPLMSIRNPEKLRKLLTQNRLKKRALELSIQWRMHGVQVSTVAHGRYWKLIDRLGGGRSWPLKYVADLSAEMNAFVRTTDLITVIGWIVEEEPPILISSEALLRTTHVIKSIYADGFILINDESARALLVDIDEHEGIHAGVIELPN